MYSNISLPSKPRALKCSDPIRFSDSILLCIFLPMRATWSTNLDQPQVYFQEHKLWCSLLYTFLHPAVTSCLSGANILLMSYSRAPVIYQKCWISTGTGPFPFLLTTHCYPLSLCVATDDSLYFMFEIFRIVPGRQYVFVLLRDLWLKPVIKELVLLFRTELTLQNAISAYKRPAGDAVLFPTFYRASWELA